MELFGNFDEHIKLIERHYGVDITFRDTALKVSGIDRSVAEATRAINELIAIMQKGESITDQTIRYIFTLVDDGNESEYTDLSDDLVCITAVGKPIKPKTLGQKKYISAIRQNSITIGVGPAGTGKTYLAVALAVNAFRKGDVRRIILTRPAVEAGEKLGFLPGDLQQKVDPYLRPLYDALLDTLGADVFQRSQERGEIEVAPLAYMRGRTLDDSFIILDEAQNTTKEQMKMFLTRMGYNSKIVVTGDITQIDLPTPGSSGLVDAISVLKGIEDIEIITLSDKDVVRHRLVSEIIRAYSVAEEKRQKRKNKGAK
jgi:phosphate starvation-inducible PhoH-like protein